MATHGIMDYEMQDWFTYFRLLSPKYMSAICLCTRTFKLQMKSNGNYLGLHHWWSIRSGYKDRISGKVGTSTEYQDV